METLKFKTNISSFIEIREIGAVLKNISGIREWIVDLDSIYNLLIIEGVRIKDSVIITALNELGFKAIRVYEE